MIVFRDNKKTIPEFASKSNSVYAYKSRAILRISNWVFLHSRLVSTNGFEFWESPGMGYPMICQTLSLPHWLLSYSDFQMIFFLEIFFFKNFEYPMIGFFFRVYMIPIVFLQFQIEFSPKSRLFFQIKNRRFTVWWTSRHGLPFCGSSLPVVSLVAELPSWLDYKRGVR